MLDPALDRSKLDQALDGSKLVPVEGKNVTLLDYHYYVHMFEIKFKIHIMFFLLGMTI